MTTIGLRRQTLLTALLLLVAPTVGRAGLVPGGGSGRSDCYVEAELAGVAVPSSAVEKGKRALCIDGDACDSGACGDDACNFDVAVCVNQSDPNLPDCVPPAGLDRLKTRGPTTLPSPDLTGPACSAAQDVKVDVKVRKGRKKPGKAKLTLAATAAKGTKPRKDTDRIQLVCAPRTDACPPPTTTTTSSTTTTLPVPSLVGLDPDKPRILPLNVQVAYNDDTIFFHTSWEGDRGDTHDYVRFAGGAWRTEGGPRRDAQATIDNDPARGPTNINSTIYESRIAFMVNDPGGPNAVADFNRFGCFLTCHDDARGMPIWDSSNDRSKYLPAGTTGALDLWHHRLARANPIGASDDQHVTVIPPGQEETGGRLNDQGDSPWQTNDITGGQPTFAFDPTTSGGLFAFKFPDLFQSPLRFFRRADALEQGAGPVAVGIAFADALAQGYVPQEDDTIPFRRLRTPTGSRGDITGFGTTFTPSAEDPLFGRIDSNVQRLLDTGNADDTALADGGVYDVAFAVHTGMVTIRDHYVSFPMKLSLGGGAADIQAVKVAGSGRATLPSFSDTATFPVKRLNLFLPGISSFEFVRGEDTGLQFIDPQTGSPVDQMHGGATFLVSGGLGCQDCHTAASTDPFEPTQGGGFAAGAMQTLVPQRGGVNTPTPIPPAGP